MRAGPPPRQPAPVREIVPAHEVAGPRGPARTAQPGAVWLAKLTGSPVVPFHMEASSSWSLKSWDRTQIPKPFATVAIAIGVGGPAEQAASGDESGTTQAAATPTETPAPKTRKPKPDNP